MHGCLKFVRHAASLAVWFDDPILGMLEVRTSITISLTHDIQFMNYWFGAFLFGSFLIALSDLCWLFELFYYILPFQYYLRSQICNLFADMMFSLAVLLRICSKLSVSALLRGSMSLKALVCRTR